MPEPPPSVGEAQELLLSRGGAGEIVVKGIVMPGNSLKIEVVTKPKHGSLGKPRRISSHSMAFPYTHNGQKATGDDQVEFKLKTAPENSWSYIWAKIFIQEPTSRLQVEPESLDFGIVTVGESKNLVLQIKNVGGGQLRGVAEVEPSLWKIEGAADFKLLEGESQDLQIAFSPKTEGIQKSSLLLRTGPSAYREVRLSGGGQYRFAVPQQVAILRNGENAQGIVRVENRAHTALNLEIQAPFPVLTKPQIQIPSGEFVDLPLSLEKKHYTAERVEVTFWDGGISRSMQVDLPEPPALLEWKNGPVFDVGRVPCRNVPEIELALENPGATPAKVTLEDGVDGLFLAPSQSRSLELAAGETAAIRAYWQLPEVPGRATAKITAKNGGVAHILEVVAEVEDAQPVPEIKAPKKSIVPLPISEPEEVPGRSRNRLTKSESEKVRRRFPKDIVYFLEPEFGSATAVLTWKYHGPQPVSFEIQRQAAVRDVIDPKQVFEKRLELPEKLPSAPVAFQWVPVESAGIQKLDDAGTWQARVSGLPSGQHALRIGARSPPDFQRIDYEETVIFVGKIPRPAWVDWLLWLFVILCLAYVFRRKIFTSSPESHTLSI